MISGSDLRVVVPLLLALTRSAAADTADEAFKRGRELYKAGKFPEACAAFEASLQLDPSFGTRFNIAQCDEKVGKLATALRIYRDLAEHDTNAPRKATSAELAAKLEPRVPRLQIHIDPKPPGVIVTLAGAPHACEPDCGDTPVDFGTYAIVARAPGFRDGSTSVTVAEETKVFVAALHLEPIVEPGTALPKPMAVAPPHGNRKTYATVAMVGGGAALVAGGVFGVLARGAWKDAKAVCSGTTTCATDADTRRASDLGDGARLRANLSTALFVVGGIAAAGGVVLWVTGPSEHAITVAASVTEVTLSGRF